MRQRGLVVLVALLLAVAAATSVFLYLRGVREDARTGADMVSVITAKQDIPAGTELNELIERGAFAPRSVPRDAVVRDAVTDLGLLRGKITTAPIVEGEQISAARLQGSAQVGGGLLGIPAGYEAITVSLPMPRAGGGVVQAGDRVTVYATFTDVALVRGSVEDFLAGRARPDNQRQTIGDLTVTVVPEVRILRVDGATAATAADAGGEIQLTMALRPQDGQKLIFAQEKGSVWLAVLPPEQAGVHESPVNIFRLLQDQGRKAA